MQIKIPKIIQVGLVVIVISISVGVFYFLNSQKINKISTQVTNQVATNLNFPFFELTIPGLRQKKYESKLGNLEKYSTGVNYTAYLTSYISEGNKINGLLTIPNGEKPVGGWKAIVFVHGYIPPSQYSTTQKYEAYVDYLARNNFVVFKIDLRGHGESEGQARGGYYSPDYVIDTLNARAALQNTDFVNPEQVGLWGHSMAGNVVSRAIAVKTDIPAVVIWGGAVYSYSDMQKYGISDNSYRPPQDANRNTSFRAMINNKYGQFDPSSEFWSKVPMTNYLNDIQAAISLNHAIDDDVVDIGYSRDLNALLDKTNIVHELNEYPSGGHNISGIYFSQAMQNTVNFFNKYLN